MFGSLGYVKYLRKRVSMRRSHPAYARIVPDAVMPYAQSLCGPFIIVCKASRVKQFDDSGMAVRRHQDEVRKSIAMNAQHYLNQEEAINKIRAMTLSIENNTPSFRMQV
jgi:hypothetical protein